MVGEQSGVDAANAYKLCALKMSAARTKNGGDLQLIS